MTLKRSLLAALLLLSTCSAWSAVKRADWGTADDHARIDLYTLSNRQLSLQLTNYGARIVSIEAPDRDGKRADVVLGFRDASQYVQDPKAYFGATIGRYANRLAKGTFVLKGQTYHVPLNNNANALHGGPEGFSTRLWKTRITGPNSIEFTLLSRDGDMGFPGDLLVHVRYTLLGSALQIDYSAKGTKTTVLNLTNHTYFNLGGEASGDILNEEIMLNANSFTPINSALIPTGKIAPVDGTPFDFRTSTPIGKHITQTDEQLTAAGGYDHNFVLSGQPGEMHNAAFAFDPVSGRTLTVLTTEPGVQFYSGNFLNGTLKGYTGKLYQKHAGFCLETQHFPDSPNQPNFPSTTLLAGKTFHSTTRFIFGTSTK
jgi:aldose 1-epimerase